MRIVLFFLAWLLIGCASVSATPKTMIDLTQFDMKYFKNLNQLKADWCMATVTLTPELRGEKLKQAIKALGCRIVLTTDGGINPGQLLDEPNWTGQPRNLGTSGKILKEAGVPVHYTMLYTEFNRQDEHSTLLTPDEYRYARKELNNQYVLPLARVWDALGAAKLKSVLTLPKTELPGVFLELAADVNYIKSVKACEVMKFAKRKERFLVVMLSGKTPSTDYANDVKKSCEYIKSKCPGAFDVTTFGVAIYETPQKGINWIGGKNSVSEAMKKLKECVK